jgi:hypothetical protein
LLNANDIKVFIDFASPGFDPGTVNFGAKLGNNVGDLLTYIDSKLNPPTNTVFTSTLLPGEWLFGGPGNNNTLTLQNGDVADGILIDFEHLVITSGFSGTLSIRQWNDFYPSITGGGAGSTAIFRDGLAPFENNLIILNQIGHYDFSKLTKSTGGVTVTTEAFLGTGPAMGANYSLIATDFDDTFNVEDDDLKNAMTIDGGKGIDTLNVDAVLTFGNKFGQTAGGAGTTDAVVLNVEHLNLLDGTNNVGFNLGTQFTQVIGGTGQDIIRDPQNLDPGWFLDVMGGSGFATNVVQVDNPSNDLAQGTIQATGGFVGLDISAKGASNTRMTFEQYTLFENSQFGPFFGIFLSDGSTFGNTTITFANQVTGGAELDDDVGFWVFESKLADTFTLGDNDQSINVIPFGAGTGGADTAILNLGGKYDGTFVGDADDTIKFTTGANGANLSGINGGAATTFGKLSFDNKNLSVSMTVDQHEAFSRPFLDTGKAGNFSTQTITLTTTGTATGDRGIEKYNLTGGNDTFRVAPDNADLTNGHQDVDFKNGNDTVVFGDGTFSGTASNFGNAGDLTKFIGNADVSDFNSGGAISPAVDFTGASVSVTMTVTQHNAYGPNTANFTGTGGIQTIALVDGGTTSGDVGIENYVLVTGPGDAYNFTVHNNAGMANPPQNVTVTSSGATDTIRFGDGNFSGKLVGLDKTTDHDIVQFFGNADIHLVNNGKVTGADIANFSNKNISVSMTLEQHNGFSQTFAATANTQTITLTTSGTATGDAGIEQYFLASGNDVFTVAPNNANLVGGVQNVDINSGGSDVLIFGSPFSGKMNGVTGDDTYRFITGGGDVNIAGLINNGGTAGGVTGAGTFDFTNANLVVSMTADQHQHPGPSPIFINTANTQTIVLTTTATVTGDAGIEQYILKGPGNDKFTVGAFGQSVDLQGGGSDTVNYGNGTWTGNLTNGAADDTVKFTGNTVGTDISGVNGGNSTGVGTFDFNNANIVVSMTLAQHNGPSSFSNTANTQTIKLTTSGTATGNGGIEQYILASGNDVFTVAPNNGSLVGGAQNVDIFSGGADVLVFGSPFSGKMNGVASDDTYRFIANGSDVDIHLLINNTDKVGGVTGAGTFDFTNANVVVSMTVEQHNGPLPANFINTGGSPSPNGQTIVFTNDGTATGNAGIETYVLGQDGSDSNKFTIGAPGQNVTGRGDDDIVINPYGGLTGILVGGGNHGNGDTLILQAANTVIKAGSGGFENLTLQAVGNSTVTMDVAFHNGVTKNVVAPGLSDTIILTDNGTLTGLFGIENYNLGPGANNFTFTNSQTGTITGNTGIDVFNATAAQVAAVQKIDGDGGILDVLNITTDAGGLNLNTKTTNIEIFNLLAGSTSNVFGVNANGVLYNATGNTIFTMGTGSSQNYVGGTGLGGGTDKVTFGSPAFLGSIMSILTQDGDDYVKSTVGGSWSGLFSVVTIDGGAGQNTLELAPGDDLTAGLSLINVTNFTDLVIGFNGSVTMTNTQHNQFNPLSTVATGNNTMNIADAFTGTTMAQVENYVLANGAANHAYTISQDGQKVTDLDTAGSNTANINAGLSDVTVVTSGANYAVNSLGGGTNLKVTGGSGADVVSLAGGHTGVNISTGGGNDTVNVTGSVAGTLDGGAHGANPPGDTLHVNNTADLANAIVTVNTFETLDFAANASVTMTAATWDQFVALNGQNAAGHQVTGATGVETVTLTTTTGNSAAFTGDGINYVENYNLTSALNDTFKVNAKFAGIVHFGVDLVGGGTDTITLNDDGVISGADVSANVLNFKSGGGSGFDILSVQHSGTSISNGNFLDAFFNTNVGAGVNVVNVNTTIIGDIASVWTQAVARTYLDAGIGMIAVGEYTMVAYNGADADIMTVKINTANTFADANIDLVGVLQGVGGNSMLSSNFA